MTHLCRLAFVCVCSYAMAALANAAARVSSGLEMNGKPTIPWPSSMEGRIVNRISELSSVHATASNQMLTHLLNLVSTRKRNETTEYASHDL